MQVCLSMAEPVSVFYEINGRIEELYDQGEGEDDRGGGESGASRSDLLRALVLARVRRFESGELVGMLKEMLRWRMTQKKENIPCPLPTHLTPLLSSGKRTHGSGTSTTCSTSSGPPGSTTRSERRVIFI